MSLLDYLLRSNLYLLFFFGCYYLLLRRHTFFMLNRVYLLASVALSFALPLIKLPTEAIEALPTVTATLPTAVIVGPEEPTPTGPDWTVIGWWIYGLVAVALLIRLIWRTTALLRFIRQHPQQPLSDYTLVQPEDPQTPTFSFFRYMVLSPTDRQAEAVRAHEWVHIRQWHSLDVLLFEALQAVLWFNPVLWAYRAAIRQVHEFLADAGASANHRSDYAHYLVSYALGDQPDALTNSFFKPSLLLSRLRMLHRRATSRWALGKYALVLPLMVLVLALTAARPEVERMVQPLLTANPIVVKGRVTGPDKKPLPGVNIAVRNGTLGTTTDVNGRFMLRVEPGISLVVSFVGFETKEIVAKAGMLTVQLVEKSAQKVGRAQATSRVSERQVTVQENKEVARPAPGVGDVVPVQPQGPVERGPVEGIIYPEPGSALKGTSIRVRGSSRWFSDKEPLYILDGVRINNLNAISPNDIESISVLKNESATAIYGDTAISGVVIIKTKTGKKNAIKLFDTEKH